MSSIDTATAASSHDAQLSPISSSTDVIQPFLRPFPSDLFSPLCHTLLGYGEIKTLLDLQKTCWDGWRAATPLIWKKVMIREEKDWLSLFHVVNSPEHCEFGKCFMYEYSSEADDETSPEGNRMGRALNELNLDHAFPIGKHDPWGYIKELRCLLPPPESFLPNIVSLDILLGRSVICSNIQRLSLAITCQHTEARISEYAFWSKLCVPSSVCVFGSNNVEQASSQGIEFPGTIIDDWGAEFDNITFHIGINYLPVYLPSGRRLGKRQILLIHVGQAQDEDSNVDRVSKLHDCIAYTLCLRHKKVVTTAYSAEDVANSKEEEVIKVKETGAGEAKAEDVIEWDIHCPAEIYREALDLLWHPGNPDVVSEHRANMTPEMLPKVKNGELWEGLRFIDNGFVCQVCSCDPTNPV